MKPIRLWAALSLALFLSVRDLTSQCTHTSVNATGATIKAGGVQPCDLGLTVTLHGLTLRLGHCPVFLLVTPAHHESVAVAGCGTDAVVAARLPMHRHTVRCARFWFLFADLFGYCAIDPPVIVRLIDDHRIRICDR